jgi:thioesterase domain-containing protein/acyl carrier protein
MLPSDIVVLDRLPLSANGKLDRKALPEPGGDRRAAYRAPRTPREQLLCGLYAELLGVDRVGIDDGFFDLGGHSLRAAELVAAIRQTLAVDLSVAAVFRTPTVAGLAAALDAGDTDDGFGAVLPIRAHGDEPPLFCVHPGVGLGWCYAVLARHLPRAVPIIALQSPYLNGGELPADLDGLARDYVRRLKEIRPTGPYRLAGWSFGGNLAHAMAVLLQAQGDEVDLLAVLDGYPFAGSPGPVDTDPVEVSLHEVKARHLDGVTASVLADDRIATLAGLLAGHTRLAERHRPGRYRGDLVFVRATGHADEPHLRPVAWSSYVDGEIDVRSVDAGHHDLLGPDTAGEVAAALRRDRN